MAVAVLAVFPNLRQNDFFIFSGLRYSVKGPVCIVAECSYKISVRNNGFASQEAVEITLPDRIRESDKITVSTNYKIEDKSSHSVIVVGDLRPNDAVEVVVVAKDAFYVGLDELPDLKITSKTSQASNETPSQWWSDTSVWLAYIISALFVVLIAYAILEPNAWKRRRLEHSIVQFRAELEKLPSAPAPAAVQKSSI